MSQYDDSKHVPKRYKTKELCEKAFAKDHKSFRNIPDMFKTAEMCLSAVSHSGYFLEWVPPRFVTRELCIMAVSDGGTGVDYVPEKFFDKELAMLAIENATPWVYNLLNTIPAKLRDHEVCLAAVKRCASDLQFVPDSIVDLEICKAAAEKGASLEHILDWIPGRYLTPEICMILVNNGFPHLNDLPKQFVTQEICNAAVESDLQYFFDVPDEFITEDMLLLVAEKAPALLANHFPMRFRTHEIIDRFTEKNPKDADYFQVLLSDPGLNYYGWRSK